jgi:hypothetical protein
METSSIESEVPMCQRRRCIWSTPPWRSAVFCSDQRKTLQEQGYAYSETYPDLHVDVVAEFFATVFFYIPIYPCVKRRSFDSPAETLTGSGQHGTNQLRFRRQHLLYQCGRGGNDQPVFKAPEH